MTWMGFICILFTNIVLVGRYWDFKGGYLDFSHLTELKNICITKIYMKKQFKSSITKNHKTRKKKFLDGVPLKGYIDS